MLESRGLIFLLSLVVSGTSATLSSRRYGDLHPEERMTLVEKMKYVMPRDADGDAETSRYPGLPTGGCPFFMNITRQLEQQRHQREEAIKAALKTVKTLIASGENCSNTTEVRNEILTTLNASLTCEPKPACDSTKAYREIDGSCNNLEHPDWGKTDSCLRRVLSPAYADGVSKPRLACDGSPLPSARLVSMTLHEQRNVTHENLTHLAMIFGQFVTHDITFVSFAPLSHIEFELAAGRADLYY